MNAKQPPPQMPPPLPKESGALKPTGLAAQDQKRPHSQQQAVKPSAKKRSSLAWLWVLIPLAIAGIIFWQYQLSRYTAYEFQSPEMAMARYTPKDVIGDLGGLKVRIPRHYAEYVEYDDDPSWGEKRKGPVPERTFDSKLRSFGIEARFPDMVGLENDRLRKEYRSYHLNSNNPWIDISITSGSYYPGLGVNARNGRAKKLWTPSDYWAYNFERLDGDVYGLEMYVVKGLDPHTGQLARESRNTKDIYIERDASGHVHSYIECGRPSVPTGISRCKLEFGLEPEAKVAVEVYFYPKLFPYWREIKQSVSELLLGFEFKEADSSEKEADVSNVIEGR